MKIAVIGSGIIGITTAYELACDGHEVTVIERRSAAAEETSFANAGVMAPGSIAPWASPGMPTRVLTHLLSRHTPARLSWPLSSHDMAWMWKWFRSCRLKTYLHGRSQLQSLAFYSRERLHLLNSLHHLDYDHSIGHLVLLRSAQDLGLLKPGLQLLRDAGVAFEEMDAQAARLIEPGINPGMKFFGAIHLPDDEVANCRQVALLLKRLAQELGVHFDFNKTVTALQPSRPVQVAVAGEERMRHYDAVVACAGAASANLLRPLGLHLPLTAVHGYSLTARIREPLNAPVSALTDERYKVAIVRLGNRIRIAGGAEIGGRPDRHNPAAIRTLYKVLHDWFPGAAQLAPSSAGVQVWKGASPMLPDGPPIVSASGLPGLWLNLGHGSSGWALSCGSARVLADLVAGKQPDIDTSGFRAERLARLSP